MPAAAASLAAPRNAPASALMAASRAGREGAGGGQPGARLRRHGRRSGGFGWADTIKEEGQQNGTGNGHGGGAGSGSGSSTQSTLSMSSSSCARPVGAHALAVIVMQSL